MPGLCSVLCVSYNHARFVTAGLQSIYEQTYRNIEIIVLDDGSTDNSPEVIRRLLAQSPFPTKFIEQKNTGNVPENFNKAFHAAAGEFVTLMSLDDILMPNCVLNAVNVLSETQNIVFAANTGHFEIDESGQRMTSTMHVPAKVRSMESAQDLLELEYEALGAFYIQGQVFRHDVLLAIGCFDDAMTGDDIILRTRLFQHMVKNPELGFFIGTDVVFAYRKHGDNLHKNMFRQIKTIIEWKEKYFPERPYPALFFRWLDSFFSKCIKQDRYDEIRMACSYSPIISESFNKYQKTLRFKRNVLKQKIRQLIRLA